MTHAEENWYSLAKMFNRQASDPRNKPDRILKTSALQPGQTICDIGTGGGYFSVRFASEVGREGKIYAIDTDPQMFEFVRNAAEQKVLNNIKTILMKGDDLALPERSLDLVFLRNVYHHLSNRIEYLKRIRILIKPQGRVPVIEYRRGGPLSFRRLFGHYVPQDTIMNEMKEAGYILKEAFDFLPEQSLTIYGLDRIIAVA